MLWQTFLKDFTFPVSERAGERERSRSRCRHKREERKKNIAQAQAVRTHVHWFETSTINMDVVKKRNHKKIAFSFLTIFTNILCGEALCRRL